MLFTFLHGFPSEYHLPCRIFWHFDLSVRFSICLLLLAVIHLPKCLKNFYNDGPMKLENPDHKILLKNRLAYAGVVAVMMLLMLWISPKKKNEPEPEPWYLYEIKNGDTTKIDITDFDSAQLDSLVHSSFPAHQPDSAEEAELQAWQDSVFKMDDFPLVDSLLKKWQ